MSFSPEITESYYLAANIFAPYEYQVEPLPSYASFRSNNGVSFTGYADEPVGLPTLKSFGDGTEYANNPDALVDVLTAGADYFVYCVRATLAHAPITSIGSSRFLKWDHGFGFGFFTQVWAYSNGAPGDTDTYISTFLDGDLSDNWMNVDSSYNGAEAAAYYETEFNTTPYDIFFYDIRFALAGDDLTQVLYKSDFVKTNGNNSPFKIDGRWVLPSSTTVVSRSRYAYPYPSVPEPSTTTPDLDLTLYRQNYSHNYDSTYGYVRDDIKQRFKTTDIINTQRDEYIDSIVSHLYIILSTTNSVPRGFTLRKQPSPKVNKETYTTFTNDDSMIEGTTTTMTAGMTSARTGGGSY